MRNSIIIATALFSSAEMVLLQRQGIKTFGCRQQLDLDYTTNKTPILSA